MSIDPGRSLALLRSNAYVMITRVEQGFSLFLSHEGHFATMQMRLVFNDFQGLRIVLFVSSLILADVVSVGAQGLATGRPEGSVVLQFFGGTALNLPTRLTVHHLDLGSVRHSATWETRPLDQPFYWALRARWQRRDDGLELQFLHHKMYLKNNPGYIDHLEVTHGFNVLTVNYLRRTYPVQPRLGLGVVIPDAESTVLGEFHQDGYKIGGLAVLLGAGWEHALARHLVVAADAQFVAGWTSVDVDRGEARVRSLALHLLVGVGAVF